MNFNRSVRHREREREREKQGERGSKKEREWGQNKKNKTAFKVFDRIPSSSLFGMFGKFPTVQQKRESEKEKLRRYKYREKVIYQRKQRDKFDKVIKTDRESK